MRELTTCTPTFVFLQVHNFFSLIFLALKDVKPVIREMAAAELRAVLVVTAQPETRETRHMEWYQQCYAEAEKGNGY